MSDRKSVVDRLADLSTSLSNYNDVSKFTPSGSVVFDAVLSEGKGVPSKTFIQISSESGLGKSTLCLHMSRMACASGKDVIYIDSEKAVNSAQLEGIGLTPFVDKNFSIHRVDTYKQVEEILDLALDTPSPDLAYIFIDSITDLMLEDQMKKSVEEVEMMVDSRIISKFLLKYRAKLNIADTDASIVFINQLRNKRKGMNIVKGEGGGFAQQYRMDVRLELRLLEYLKRKEKTLEGEKEVKYGSHVILSAPHKNRYAMPDVGGVLTILFGRGVSNIAAYQRLLTAKGLLMLKGGGNYILSLPGQEEKKVRGKNKVEDLIRDNLSEVKAWVESLGGYKLVESIENSEDE